MRTYLVGGAVRDELLGIPVVEKDYCVVGGSEKEMLQKGYVKVGKSFPVFLHPDTKEEYALARKETKVSSGYRGFDCYAGPEVSLDEDLLRRDLTINAMAKDEAGVIIDPYGGQKDIASKYLRHVSNAFVEDPVRVLRVARFAARFAHLGFKVADETYQLMYQMVKAGEVSSLVAERVWQETHKALSERNPDEFFKVLRRCGALAIVFPEVDALFGVPQRPSVHPEIDSGVHTLMVLRKATHLSQCAEVRFAALTHDLGKAKTPMEDWPGHRSHEQEGVSLLKSLCERLKVPKSFQQLALLACKYHGAVHQSVNQSAGTLVELLQKLDAFRNEKRFNQLLVVCKADSLGRKDHQDDSYRQAAFLQNCLDAVKSISIDSLPDESRTGEQIKDALFKARTDALKAVIERMNNG